MSRYVVCRARPIRPALARVRFRRHPAGTPPIPSPVRRVLAEPLRAQPFMTHYGLVSYHRSMVFDEHRNAAYVAAIRERVGPTSVVLDLGAGVGRLGLEAARQGARKVYLVDPEPVVHLGQALAAANGLADRVEVIRDKIEQVRLPEPVDVILSVFTGNFLLEEDLLPLLFSARDRFLRPGGRLIPDWVRMEIAPVEAAAHHAEQVGVWGARGDGMDYSAGRRYAANSLSFDTAERLGARLLAAPACLAELDLLQATTAECRASVEVRFERDGTCHGLLGWFAMRLGTSWLSTAPLAPPTHWRQAFLPLDPPVPVARGQVAVLGVRRPEYGDWSWTFSSEGIRRHHSSFLAVPVARSEMEKIAGFHRPRPNARGLALAAALAAMDGRTSVDVIAERVFRNHPDAFVSPGDAGQFVRRLVRRYT